MICEKCGRYNPDNVKTCKYCSNDSIEAGSGLSQQTDNYQISRTGRGILFSFLLGGIGLLIGMLSYGNLHGERRSFIKGWIIGFSIQLSLMLLRLIIVVLVS